MKIVLQNVNYFYNYKTPFKLHALKNVNLEINPELTYGIIGPTGSGKSTISQLFDVLIQPQSGNVCFYDQVTTYIVNQKRLTTKLKFNIRQRHGFVFQFPEYQLFAETVMQDVIFGPLQFGFSKEVAVINATKYLSLLGIDESLYQRSPLSLSGGQKRRVAMAGILASDPELIIFDEPTAGLDPFRVKGFIELVKQLQLAKKTLIIITHDLDVIYQLADKIIIMDNGQIIVCDDPYKIFTNKKLLAEHNLMKPQVLELCELINTKLPIKVEEIKNSDDLYHHLIRHDIIH